MVQRISTMDHHALKSYSKHLQRNATPFTCPLCRIEMTSAMFENHCSSQHGLNATNCCVWCQGKVSWRGDRKCLYSEHLMQCWQKFIGTNQSLCPADVPDAMDWSEMSNPVPFDMTPMAPEKCLFEHDFDPPPRAFDLLWPMPLDPNPLTFEDDPLNTATACVRKYLSLNAKWFHVSVRALAFKSFLQAMDDDSGHTMTLPFSCWCDAGTPSENRQRQHRHLIVVSPSHEHFIQNVWKKVVPDDPPRKNFRSKHYERINSAMHLVNVIGYVSRRKSQCHFSGKRFKKLNHFYIFQKLPKAYRLPLVLQWDGGLLQLLNQEKKNLKVRNLMRSALKFENQNWHLKIKNIPGIPLGTVLPVSKHFIPCSYTTDSFVWLMGGNKLYFELQPDLVQLTSEEWLMAQAKMGNLFYDVVGEQNWAPRPLYQKLIKQFKPLVDRNRELEKENCELKEINQELTRKKPRFDEIEYIADVDQTEPEVAKLLQELVERANHTQN